PPEDARPDRQDRARAAGRRAPRSAGRAAVAEEGADRSAQAAPGEIAQGAGGEPARAADGLWQVQGSDRALRLSPSPSRAASIRSPFFITSRPAPPAARSPAL